MLFGAEIQIELLRHCRSLEELEVCMLEVHHPCSHFPAACYLEHTNLCASFWWFTWCAMGTAAECGGGQGNAGNCRFVQAVEEDTSWSCQRQRRDRLCHAEGHDCHLRRLPRAGLPGHVPFWRDQRSPCSSWAMPSASHWLPDSTAWGHALTIFHLEMHRFFFHRLCSWEVVFGEQVLEVV